LFERPGLKEPFGLVGSFERAVAVGGEFQIDSKPGEETLVQAIIPSKIKIQKASAAPKTLQSPIY